MSPFPGGARFAFTILDDTDFSVVENTRPVYDLLARCGLRTTKTVWVYPPRDRFTGGCLEDPDYLAFVRELQQRGVEIALHGVGSGRFSRAEIAAGLERYHALLGEFPRIHVNHGANPDNLWWGARRFAAPVSWLYGGLAPKGRRPYHGEDPASPCYWADLAGQHVRYIRNFTFNPIDTRRCDPRMPWRDPRRPEWSPGWFSSSDGHTVEEFTTLLAPERVRALEAQGGVCIVYTHFGCGFVQEGQVAPAFASRLRALAERPGWFVPVGELLDHLAGPGGMPRTASYAYLLRLSLSWLAGRLAKRLRFGR